MKGHPHTHTGEYFPGWLCAPVSVSVFCGCEASVSSEYVWVNCERAGVCTCEMWGLSVHGCVMRHVVRVCEHVWVCIRVEEEGSGRTGESLWD